MQSKAVGGRGEGILIEVGFYHLTRTGAHDALPRLLGRTLGAGQRALVRCRDVGALSATLWASEDPAWLPHGTDGDAHPALHPIWLSARADPAPNGARYLFLLDDGLVDAALADCALASPAFDRIFDLFDGHDDRAVEAARQRYRAAKAAGHRVGYNQQQAERGWVKKG